MLLFNIKNQFRGWIGEMKTALFLWLFLNKKKYHKFHNIILPSPNGTTQIDHLIISAFGVFIIETKNKKGWIFGSEQQPFWTQTIYGNKFSFQNPLRQTYRQKKKLSEFLQITESKINTVIYFAGDCKFKTSLPKNVIRSGISRYIKRFREQILSADDVNQIVNILQKHKSESSISNRDHVKSLRKRHKSNSICPRCGSNLIKRRQKGEQMLAKSFMAAIASLFVDLPKKLRENSIHNQTLLAPVISP